MERFTEGQIVEHKLNKEWMMVIKYQGKKVICRTKSLDLVEIEEFELKERE